MMSRTISRLLILGSVLLLPTPARADAIDYAIMEEASTVLRKLQKAEIRNVGVLKFRLKDGNSYRFDVGPINRNLPVRLENALVAQNPDDRPIGILREPGRIIARKGERINYLNPNDRVKLFKNKYPLLWGNEEVIPDAFLTGLIELTPDKKSTRVTIETIDQQTYQLRELTSFVVRTDRVILSDMRQNYVVRTQGGMNLENQTKFEEMVIEDAASDRPTAKDYVDLQVLYDDQPQMIEMDPSRARGERMLEPMQGQKVVFKLTNRHTETIGVVLAVNGLNTLYKQNISELPPIQCRKWILDPNETIEVSGFQKEMNEMEPFVVRSDEESLALEQNPLGPESQLGAIDLFVFIQGNDQVTTTKISTQGLRTSLLAPRQSFANAREAKKAALNLHTIRKQGLIDSDLGTRPSQTKTVAFSNPTEVQHRTIWYYERKQPKPE